MRRRNRDSDWCGGSKRRATKVWILVTISIVAFIVTAVAMEQTGKVQVEPIIGSWKMNVSASKISPTLQDVFKIAAPKQRTEVYRQISGGRIELKGTFTGIDSSSYSYCKTFPAEGGMGQYENSDPSESDVNTRISPREWYVTAMQNGKQTLTIHKIISEDGKTMQQTVTSVDSKGKPFEELRIFERQ